MRYARIDRTSVTIAEYLRREETSATRNEYYRGEIYAMSGGTARHSRITLNVLRHLEAATRGTQCRVYTSDFKVQPTHDAVYYPDASVVCGGEQSPDAVLTRSPCLVVEVTSHSSYRTDHGEKVQEYCASPSLQAYLIVDQHRRRVVSYLRDPARAEWLRAEHTGNDTIVLPCPATPLSLDAVYVEVELPPLSVTELDEESDTAGYPVAP
jgi:Uma2 family endonuclease